MELNVATYAFIDLCFITVLFFSLSLFVLPLAYSEPGALCQLLGGEREREKKRTVMKQRSMLREGPHMLYTETSIIGSVVRHKLHTKSKFKYGS